VEKTEWKVHHGNTWAGPFESITRAEDYIYQVHPNDYTLKSITTIERVLKVVRPKI